MGFYGKYFSTLFRGLLATSWKERIEARKAVNALAKGIDDIEKGRKDIKDHRVTRAIKELKRAINELKISAENADKFIFNAVTVDRQLVAEEAGIMEALMNLSNETGNHPKLLELEEHLALILLVTTEKHGEKEEREEYKLVELILNLATKRKDIFMAKLKQMFLKEGDLSRLFKVPMRSGVTRERIDIQKLKKINRDINDLALRFRAHKKGEKELDRSAEIVLTRDIKEVGVDLYDAFKNSYYIKKRDLVLIMKILYDLHYIQELLDFYVRMNFFPRESADGLKKQVVDIEKKIMDNFHPIAQGFRIVIASLDNIEKKAKVEIAKIQAQKRRAGRVS